MSRRIVTSLSYSQVPCDFLRSRAVMLLVQMARKSGMGEAFVTKLLFAMLYLQVYLHGSDKGYYAVYDQSFVDGFSIETNMDGDDIRHAITLAADAGVVDGRLFQEGIITSWSVQDAYFQASSRIRRRRPKETPYLLVDLDTYPFAKTESSEETEITSEEKEITPEDKVVSSEEKGISSEVKHTYSISTSISTVKYISIQEKETLSLVFHSERGYRAWADIVDDFETKLGAVGWKDGAGRKIEDKVLYAKSWAVREEFAQKGMIYGDDESKGAYAELYHTLKDVPGSYLLTHIEAVRKVKDTLVIKTASIELKQFIKENMDLIKKNITNYHNIVYEKE